MPLKVAIQGIICAPVPVSFRLLLSHYIMFGEDCDYRRELMMTLETRTLCHVASDDMPLELVSRTTSIATKNQSDDDDVLLCTRRTPLFRNS